VTHLLLLLLRLLLLLPWAGAGTGSIVTCNSTYRIPIVPWLILVLLGGCKLSTVVVVAENFGSSAAALPQCDR